MLTAVEAVDVALPVAGTDLLTDRRHEGRLPLAAGDVAVLREDRPTAATRGD